MKTKETCCFLTKDEIKTKLGELFKIGTYDEKCVRSVMYDLRLGEEAFVTPGKMPSFLGEKDTLSIGPGQFAILTTEEYLTIPLNILAFITIRFRYKSKGLVNISGFHVDPGFKGKLLFSVYNVGPTTVTLRRFDPVFSIFFYTLPHRVEPDEGARYRKIEKIDTEIIEALAGATVPSLESLERRVSRSETILTILVTILVGLIIGVFGAIFSGIIKI